MGSIERSVFTMRLLLFLVVVVACVSFTTVHGKRCKRLAKKFTNCLNKGYTPKTLENCKAGDGVLRKRFAKRCEKWEKNIIAKGCEIADCTADLEVEVEAETWGRHENSFLYTYAGTSYDTLEAAKEACLNNDQCNGITQEPYNNDRYTQRKGPEVHDWSPTGETSWTVCDETETETEVGTKTETETETEPEEAGPNWCRHENSFLYTYAGTSYDTLEAAKEACLNNDQCNGITQEPYNNNRYTQRRGPTVHDWSPTGETSWTVC